MGVLREIQSNQKGLQTDFHRGCHFITEEKNPGEIYSNAVSTDKEDNITCPSLLCESCKLKLLSPT